MTEESGTSTAADDLVKDLKRSRRRPNFVLLEEQETKHAKEMVALLAERESLQDRCARHWKWCLFCTFVGFLVGGVLGRAIQ